ncbi:MAG: PilT/PilU family type 4a pilus ATPase [Candidatus Omnitrophica bacterium]|nr:PilT/PilU family type 4a pilus ATPase [Candidatus Omnitrophota bacterium]
MFTKNANDKEPVFLPVDFTGMTGHGPAQLPVPSQIGPASSLDEILIFARHEQASDVHLGALKPVIFRQFGRLKNITAEILNADQIIQIISTAIPKGFTDIFEQTSDAEYVYTINGYGRFRMALIKQRNGWDLTARLIPTEIPKFENTGMPDSCAGLTKWAQGMVLITGPAGCGKTTTLAVLVEMINQKRHDHIISIEEPIEIVYEPKKCQITQREINTHTLSQSNALRSALREDPDILVVSELRDLGTIQLAVTAAETGHLVFGTMNTINAAQTISRVVNSFPAEERSIIRNMISESLRGVICQQLIPKKDGRGMVAAYEVLIVTPAVASLIRAGKTGQIDNTIITNKANGMILMDNSLEILANKGLISKEEACGRATNPASMAQSITH